MNKGLIVALAAIGAFILVCGGWGVSTSNDEVRLRNQIGGKQEANKVTYDAAWKIVQQKAEVAETAKDGFADVFVQMTQARYQNESDQLLMRWVQESNPSFDMSLFRDLSSAIEAQRMGFARDQKELIDLKREHDNLRLTFPSSLIAGGRPEADITIVTSGKTEETFSTGREDDVSVFGK